MSLEAKFAPSVFCSKAARILQNPSLTLVLIFLAFPRVHPIKPSQREHRDHRIRPRFDSPRKRGLRGRLIPQLNPAKREIKSALWNVIHRCYQEKFCPSESGNAPRKTAEELCQALGVILACDQPKFAEAE